MMARNVDIRAWTSKTPSGSEIQFGFGDAEETEDGPAKLACFKITDRHQNVIAEFGLADAAFHTLMSLINQALIAERRAS